MWKWLIGPALLGSGCLAGSVYGRDSEQVVHRSPGDTYAALERALGNIRPSGTTFLDGGTPMPYELRVERELDRRLVVTLFFSGKEGAEAEFDFAPLGGGKSTLITMRAHGDHAVLRTALAGTTKARLAYAPDWALNLAARPLLKQLAQQIEQGGTAEIAGMTPGEAEANWESSLSEEQRSQVQEWRQYDASRPTSDPDAAAAEYMNGGAGEGR